MNMKMYIHFLTGYRLQLLSSSIVAFGIFSYGFGHIWVSPAILKLLANESNDTPVQITDTEGSWIASISLMTLPFSSFGTIFLANHFGTKSILMVAPFPLIISWILIYFAQNVWYFYAARVMVGISDALFYNCGQIYVSEIADPKIRGTLQFLTPIMFNTASFLTYYFGYILSIRTFAWLCIIPAVVYFILFLGMPPSPYFLIIQKKYEEAEVVLKLFRGKDYKDDEMGILQTAVEEQMKNKVTFKTAINNYPDRIALSIVFMAMLFQNLSGSTAVASYWHFIINQSAIYIDTDKIALVAGLLTVLGNICSLIWIDRKGRRSLLITSMFASFILMLALGIVSASRENRREIMFYDWFMCIGLCLYIFFVNFGMVNMSLLLAGELFASNMKNYGVSVVLVTYGVSASVINKVFIVVTDSYGMSYTFFGFCICSFVGFILYTKYLPETRQKSLIEIQEMLQQRKKSKEPDHRRYF